MADSSRDVAVSKTLLRKRPAFKTPFAKKPKPSESEAPAASSSSSSSQQPSTPQQSLTPSSSFSPASAALPAIPSRISSQKSPTKTCASASKPKSKEERELMESIENKRWILQQMIDTETKDKEKELALLESFEKQDKELTLLTTKWTQAAQFALEELKEHAKKNQTSDSGEEITLESVCKALNVDPQLVGVDVDVFEA